MNDTKRTTTEVILEIESKVNKILSYITTQDFMLKNIANRISKLEKAIASPEFKDIKKEEASKVEPNTNKDEEFPDFEKQPQVNSSVTKMPGLKEGIFVNKDQVNVNRNASSASIESQIADMNKKTTRKNQHATVPVQQRVTYVDGTPIAMASVELLINNNGVLESFKKLKTNATGKWTNAIPSGEYLIKVFKSKNFNKNEVRIEMAINVPDNGSSVQLNDLVANV